MRCCFTVSLIVVTTYIFLTLAGCKGDIEGPAPPGPAWVTFSASSTPLPDNVINEIYVDRELRVWFATNNGAAYFKDKSWGVIRDSLKYIIYDHSTPIPVYSVTAITQGKDRSIWFGLRGGGVVRYNQYSQNGNIWTRYKSPTLISDYIASIAPDISEATVDGEM